MATSNRAAQRRTIFEVPAITKPLHWFARAALRLIGWRIEGQVPDCPKCVVVVAPHTSNWDFPMAMLYVFALNLHVSYLGKAELFESSTLGWLFYWLGGIPVDRTRAHDVVGAAGQAFRQRERLFLGLAPEGTRKKVSTWKSGFYRIAVNAQVPIALAFLDYRRKAAGFGPTFMPSGDLTADLGVIRDFYAGVTGYHPELASLPAIPGHTPN